jgi:4-hydroxy-tetrahydrodipicolinate synthase
MKVSDIKGIIPPILTPMNDDEEQTVNHRELRNQVERLLAGGVHGIFPFGTNGEGYILSFREKEEVLETVIDQVHGRVPVYAGTGCISTADTIRMSKRAEQLGADALSIITPSFALASQKELYDHYVAVAKAVNIPIILYNIPPRTGNKLLPETVRDLCRDVDLIVGAKDSSGDLENLKAYIRLTRELDKDVAILAGNDGAILSCLKEGGAGGIAGRANIWPSTVASIYDRFMAGDLEGAQEAQDAIAVLQSVFQYGNPNTIIKTAVALLGYPVGKCRAPFNYVPPEGIEALQKVLADNKAKGMA